MFNQPRRVIEKTSAGTLRTIATSYDTAGRVYETTVSAPGLGTAVPTRRNVYDLTTGRSTATQSVVDGAVSAVITRQYDTLGRQIAYADADGNQSSTTYDLLGRVAVSNDGKATRTYAYNQGAERRGLVTSVVDSQVGAFAASYNPDGAIAVETWPNGVTATTGTNETGAPVSQAYTRSGCTADCTLYAESVVESAHGQWREHSSTLSEQSYAYDPAGRLTSTADTAGDQCQTRKYTFDAASNLTASNEYASSDDGTCQTTAVTATRTAAYDTADRITTSGYTYDALGRSTTVPASDTANPAGDNLTVTYHATDLVDTITQNERTTDYTLDVDGERIRSWTDNGSDESVQATHHYDADDDNPTWTQETPTLYTRVVSGMSGMAAIYNSGTGVPDWQLANLHGDNVATIDGSDAGLTTTAEATEYGNPRNTADVGATRYGWLGNKQRAADTPAGIVLMGVRLYNPTTGRFLQTDPVPDGSCNPYEYTCGDSINKTDLDGKRCWWRWGCRKARQARNYGSYYYNHYRADYRRHSACYYSTSGAGCRRARNAGYAVGRGFIRAGRRAWPYLRSCATWAGIGYGAKVVEYRSFVRVPRAGWLAAGACAAGFGSRFARNRGWI